MRARCPGIVTVALLAATAAAAQSFTNVTSDVGLSGVQAFRVAIGDLNGDGYADILIHLEPNHASGDVLDKQLLYLNEPGDNPGDPFSRKFVDHTAGSGIRDNRAGTGTGRHSDAAIFGDVDNDGDLDVFTNVYLHREYTLNEGTNDLLINDGTAHFTLSPDSSFHTQENWNTPAAVFVDYDNDGNLDLYIGTWYKPDSTMNADRLYRGGGDGSFTDVTSAALLDVETTCVYAVAAFDWNNDGFMDLFAPPYSRSVPDSTARHWKNNGDGTFTQVQQTTDYHRHRGWPSFSIFPLSNVSFGTMPRDFDNDGDIDFFEIMTHGTGDGGSGTHSTVVSNLNEVFSWDFERVYGRDVEDPDLTHHGDHFASWFDYDGDMRVDLVLTESGYGNPRLYLFRQQSDHSFAAVTQSTGLWEVNTDGVEPGYVTPVDYDLDGDEDLVVTTNTGIRVYRNDVGTLNNWIALRLAGVGAPGFSNKSAIGARVEVTAGGVTQTQEVYAGNGHEGPMRPLTLYFGLGQETNVDLIRIRWPDQNLTIQDLTDVAVNQFLTVEEDCADAPDPANLTIAIDGDDLVLTWDDPALGDVTWNVYRDPGPDPATWGPPLAEELTDGDPGTPGIQYRDVGAVSAGTALHYLATAKNVCGETPLR